MKKEGISKKLLALILALAMGMSNAVIAHGATPEQPLLSESYQNAAKDSGGTEDTSEFLIEAGVLKKYTGNQEEVEIPGSVTKIGSGTFQNNAKLQKVTIPSTVETIGENAFSYCGSLRTVIMEKGSLKTIDKNAFYNCSNLQDITVPEGVLTVGTGAFAQEGSSFKSIDLPSSVQKLGTSVTDVFEKSSGLTDVNVSSGNTSYASVDGAVYSADEKTMYFCPRGKTGGYTVSEETTQIAPSAFAGCLLDYAGLPSGLESIGDSAFKSSKLVSATLPDSVKSMGDYAFYNCGKLENVYLGTGLESIGKYAFSACYKLNGLSIPSSMKQIGAGMADDLASSFQWMVFAGSETVLGSGFMDSTRGIPIYGPKGSTIEQYIAAQSKPKFSFHPLSDFIPTNSVTLDTSGITLDPNTSKVLTASVKPDNAVAKVLTWISTDSRIASVDNTGKVTAKQEGTCTVFVKSGDGKSASCKITVGEDTKNSDYKISAQGVITEYGGSKTNLSIPEEVDGVKVTGIGSKAFANHAELHSVTMPSGVTSIGDSAFENCRNLTSVSLNSALSSVGASAFSGCEFLSAVELPDSVTCLGEGTFSGCTRLKNVKLSSGLTAIEKETFSDCSALLQISVPNGISVLRQNAFSRSGITNITLPGSLRTVESSAFTHCYSLKSLEIPEGVTVIGDKAFFNCINLEKLSLPSTATKIGGQYLSSLFEERETVPGAKSLQTITVAEKNPVYSSYDGAVYSGTTLLFSPRGRTQVTVKDGTTAIGDYGFFLSFHLKSVKIPPSMVSIGHDAFHYCESLTDCVLPEGLKTVGTSAFFGCETWEGMKIPSTVTDIGAYGFAECEKAKEIIIPQGIKIVRDYAFWGCDDVGKIVIPESVESIGNCAFSVSKNVTEIVIPKKVTHIGNQAFAACRMLKKVILPSGLVSIGDEAFALNDALESVFIPSSVTQLGNNIFKDCPKGPSLITDKADSAITQYAKKYHLAFTLSGSSESGASSGGSKKKEQKSQEKNTSSGTASASLTELRPNQPAVHSGNSASITVTVPDAVSQAQPGAGNPRISLSAEPVVEQLKNTAVKTVELTIQVPAYVMKQAGTAGTAALYAKAEMLQAAKETGKDLTLRVTDSQTGRELYSWMFSGKNLKSSVLPAGEINLSLDVGSVSGSSAIASAAEKNGVKQGGLVIRFGSNGLLPAPAGVRVYVGGSNGFAPGSGAYLYHFNRDTNMLEQTGQESLKVDANGFVTAAVAHCSEYVLLPKPAVNPYPVQSDTTFPVNIQKGGSYTFAITAKGSASPVLTVGNGKAFLTTMKRQGSRIFFTVTSTGTPGTVSALYCTLPGQKSVVLTHLVSA